MKDFLQAVVFGGAFLVLFLPIVVSDSMYFPFITGKNFYFRIIVEIIFAGWVVLAFLDVQYRPRLSTVLYSVGALLGIMLVANALGEYPPKSFWSNFERMEGYVTLVHFAMYFIVLASVLRDRTIDFLGWKTTTWMLFLTTAIVAALWVALTAFQQMAGLVEITQGGVRLTGTLGNAAYMAVYMLFNIFIALWLALKLRTTWIRMVMFILALVFIFLLIQTATRGTIVGLAAGLALGAGYVALFNTAYPQVRKWSLGVLIAVVVLVGGLFTFSESSFIKENRILARATNIGLEQLDLRIKVWEMALKGVEERPILGWGQGSFNYIFNREYNPEIYYAELWYDRAHNVFMDWLVAGGILGLLAYLAIFISSTYYVAIRPLFRKDDDSFTVVERGMLLGLLAAYFIHNLVVFDNIVSYILFAIVLAIIHSRVGVLPTRFEQWRPNQAVVLQVVTPIVVLVAGATLYYVNWIPMQAAKDIIRAISTQDVTQQMAHFQTALDRHSFGDQEVTEQYLQRAINSLSRQDVADADKLKYAQRAEVAMFEMMRKKPGDARLHIFLAGLYRSIGDYKQAGEQAAIARSLSPNKPSIILEQGAIAFQAGDANASLAFFKEAYELEPANADAQIFYGANLVYVGRSEEAREVVDDAQWTRFALNNFSVNAANVAADYELLAELFEIRISQKPKNPQNYTSLAFTYYQNGDEDAAIEVLKRAIREVPDFDTTGQCFIDNIAAGKTPDEGC